MNRPALAAADLILASACQKGVEPSPRPTPAAETTVRSYFAPETGGVSRPTGRR